MREYFKQRLDDAHRSLRTARERIEALESQTLELLKENAQLRTVGRSYYRGYMGDAFPPRELDQMFDRAVANTVVSDE